MAKEAATQIIIVIAIIITKESQVTTEQSDYNYYSTILKAFAL
ncbi:MAG: hypothetical protein AAF573_13805 [Bacteroidota bacterium]